VQASSPQIGFDGFGKLTTGWVCFEFNHELTQFKLGSFGFVWLCF
jgi:hypothetical protein